LFITNFYDELTSETLTVQSVALFDWGRASVF